LIITYCYKPLHPLAVSELPCPYASGWYREQAFASPLRSETKPGIHGGGRNTHCNMHQPFLENQ
jgi:hypothetical protein